LVLKFIFCGIQNYPYYIWFVIRKKSRKSAGGLENFYSKPKKANDKESGVANVEKPSKVRKKKKSGGQEGKGKLKLKKSNESATAVAAQDAGSKVEKLSLIVLEEVNSSLLFPYCN
jgi:hypothetical protein